jgi:mono/diheme cytochrome c family protein
MRTARSSRTRTRTAFLAARITLLTLAAVSALAALLAGCGGGTKSGSDGTNASTSNAPPPVPVETTVTTPPASTAPPGGDALSGDLGTRVFAQRCALCHGPDGHGDGPGSKALNPKPRNFHDTAYMSSRTDAQLLDTIHKGKGAMPKWGGVLSEAEITAALAHIRELGKKP